MYGYSIGVILFYILPSTLHLHHPIASQTIRQTGLAQFEGATHTLLQFGGAHCVTHSGVGATHVTLHSGGSHTEWHKLQSPRKHFPSSGHTFRQRGGEHFTVHRAGASGLHLMVHWGGAHSEWQSCGHSASSHFHSQLGQLDGGLYGASVGVGDQNDSVVGGVGANTSR